MAAGIKLTIILVLMTLVFAAAGGVLAQDPPPDLSDPEVVEEIIKRLKAADDPAQAFAELPPEEQQAVKDYYSDITVTWTEEVRPVSGPSGSDSSGQANRGCDDHVIIGQGRFRQDRAWTLTSTTRWCWDGTQITNPPIFNVWPRVFDDFLSYAGDVLRTESGGVGDLTHTDYIQGEFGLCFILAPCWVIADPIIEKAQHYNGTKWSRIRY